MVDERPPITPDTKVAALLEAYPELEEVLISIAPPFKKLRNPTLRRTVAKVTSLRQAAKVGDLSLGDVIGRLRVAAGIEEPWSEVAAEEGTGGAVAPPDWLDTAAVVMTLDARPMLDAGEQPLIRVLKDLKELEDTQVYALITPFIPAPMIDVVEKRGFRSWSQREGPEFVRTYFARM
jgi:hypothetical protein